MYQKKMLVELFTLLYAMFNQRRPTNANCDSKIDTSFPFNRAPRIFQSLSFFSRNSSIFSFFFYTFHFPWAFLLLLYFSEIISVI